jgi:hypothetical protein
LLWIAPDDQFAFAANGIRHDSSSSRDLPHDLGDVFTDGHHIREILTQDPDSDRRVDSGR